MFNGVHFATPIAQRFSTPFSNVSLILNVDKNLSLYRADAKLPAPEHIWTLGRFKTVNSVSWSLNGAFISILSERKCLIYSSETGKKIFAISINGENRHVMSWIEVPSKTQLLLVVNCESHDAVWCVSGEFLLSTTKKLLSSLIPIKSISCEGQKISIELENNEIHSCTVPFARHFDSIGVMAQLSLAISSATRALDDLLEAAIKLHSLRLDILNRLSLCDKFCQLLLHGSSHVADWVIPAEADFLEWKTRLKKQHAELLVHFEDNRKILLNFKERFRNLSQVLIVIDDILDRKSGPLIIIEAELREMKKELAEFLTWLEPVALNGAKTLEGLKPLDQATAMVRGILSEGTERAVIDKWTNLVAHSKTMLNGSLHNLLAELK